VVNKEVEVKMDRDFLKMKETAKILEVHENTVRDLDRKGILSARRDCRGYRRFELAEVISLKKKREELSP
jgi:DNA-binding transcriptional MerR regulator